MQLVERQSEDAPETEPEAQVDTELAERAAAVEQTKAERFRKVSIRCPQCDSQATVTRTESGAGFIIIAMSGMPHDTATFGISEAGLPICPNDRTGMVPVDAKPIAEAMADAQAQLGAAQQQPLWDPPPFDLHFAFAEIIKQQQRVTSKRETWEDAKKETKEAKDDLDKAAELLENMIAKAAADEREAIAAGLRLADPTVADNPPIEQREKELSELQEIALLRKVAATCTHPDPTEAECCSAIAELKRRDVLLDAPVDEPTEPEYLDVSRIALDPDSAVADAPAEPEAEAEPKKKTRAKKGSKRAK